jgi:predicted PP-loop superfamily ATPase
LKIEKYNISRLISKIRQEIGHKEVKIDISDVFFDEKSGRLLILTPDRPEKSAIIGKGGWVVGRLREELGVGSIHVEACSDYLVPKYRMELALEKLESIVPGFEIKEQKPLLNLLDFLKVRMENPYNLRVVLEQIKTSNTEFDGFYDFKTVVALSGGVDSSFSLILARMLGFNPLAVTVNPGDIILPRYFRDNVENLTRKLEVKHQYLEVAMDEVIEGSLGGKFHPCGRCSKTIRETVLEYSKELKAPFLIYGDLLSTGSQSIVKEDEVLRINLPAFLSANKGEVKDIAGHWGVKKRGGYGCPLLGEVHKRHPHMRRFSVQRVLRETRAGILEPGEALNQIMRSPLD